MSAPSIFIKSLGICETPSSSSSQSPNSIAVLSHFLCNGLPSYSHDDALIRVQHHEVLSCSGKVLYSSSPCRLPVTRRDTYLGKLSPSSMTSLPKCWRTGMSLLIFTLMSHFSAPLSVSCSWSYVMRMCKTRQVSPD